MLFMSRPRHISRSKSWSRPTKRYRTLEEAIAALEDLLATGEVLPSAQPRIEHRTSKPRPYVIVIGKKGKSVVESC